jgi:hypothetical protein
MQGVDLIELIIEEAWKTYGRRNIPLNWKTIT